MLGDTRAIERFIIFVVITIFLQGFAYATEKANFKEMFETANTSSQLELLLKKHPREAHNIIPKLEHTINEEIKIKGLRNRFAIKGIVHQESENRIAIITIDATRKGYVSYTCEFPGDSLPSNIGRAPSLLANGSIHRFIGKVGLDENKNTFQENGSYLFIGEGHELNRLTFSVIKNIGYVYLRGKGKVLLKDGKEIKLGY